MAGENKMKKIVLTLLLLLFSVAGCNGETVNGNITTEMREVIMSINNPIMTVNGEEREIDPGYGTFPLIENGRTVVPIRAVAENLGGSVEWNNDTQTIEIYRGKNRVLFTVNSEIAYLNDEEYILDSPPIIINERTFVPIRFVSEGLGFDVEWNENLQQITIRTKNAVNEEAGTAATYKSAEEAKVMTNGTEQEENMIDIILNINGKNFSAKLYDNDAAHSFAENLPVTYSMSELNGNEKYYYMDKSLPVDRETPSNINKGEIMLYGTDCLVIFYNTFPNSYSYTRLGYIEDVSGLESALGKEGVDVSFKMN